jgi:hypothetical protein
MVHFLKTFSGLLVKGAVFPYHEFMRTHITGQLHSVRGSRRALKIIFRVQKKMP